MRGIKKIVLIIPLDQRYSDFSHRVERHELLQIHRLDDQFIIATRLFKFKDSGFRSEDLLGTSGIEFIEVLAQDKARIEWTCFVKHRWPSDLQDFFRDPRITMNVPVIADNNFLLISFTTSSNKIGKLWKEPRRSGNGSEIVSIMTLQSPDLDNIPMLLIERQREIILYAVDKGYYEISRKINTNDLAKKSNLSQSALSEHLREIEQLTFHSYSNYESTICSGETPCKQEIQYRDRRSMGSQTQLKQR